MQRQPNPGATPLDQMRATQRAICAAIDALGQRNTFAHSGTLQGFIDPQICIDPYGPLSLPLTPADADRIIAAGRRASIGSQTLTGRVWEIESSSISYGAPVFNQMVHIALQATLAELGLGSVPGITAHPPRLVLYEAGSSCKSCAENPRTPGHFATMAICLPSAHAGGGVLVSYDGVGKRFDCPSAQTSFASWYLDTSY